MVGGSAARRGQSQIQTETSSFLSYIPSYMSIDKFHLPKRSKITTAVRIFLVHTQKIYIIRAYNFFFMLL